MKIYAGLALCLVAIGVQAREYDGRCAWFHEGKKLFDGKCHMALGSEGAAGKVWRYLITPPNGKEIELRMWDGAYTVNGVPAMQINSPASGPFHYTTAEGDELWFVRPPAPKPGEEP